MYKTYTIMQNLGVGTCNATYPLHVTGTKKVWITDTQEFDKPTIDLYSENTILTGNRFVVNSDRRIKTNIMDIDDDRALRDLRLLKPKTYTYKDTVTRGPKPVYGFIAQEVKEVLEYAASLNTDTIPNIYETATFLGDTLTLAMNTADLSRDASGVLFSRIRLKTYCGNNEYVNILEVLDTNTIKVDKDLSHWGGQVDASGELIEANKIFVYGQEVNDFHTLNKDAIWTVATAALQELDRQLQSEKQKTTQLETTLASVLARLDALEQASPAQPASQPASEPPTEPASEPSAQPASEPASEPPAQPASEPASEPPAQPASEPASEPPAQPASEPTV